MKENEREKSQGGTERPQCRRSCRGQFQKNFEYFLFFKKTGASLMTQWLKKKKKIHLPMQETPVQSLVQEDPTCHGAAEPRLHDYGSSCTLEPVLHNRRSRCSEKPPLATIEKRSSGNEDPAQPQINKITF